MITTVDNLLQSSLKINIAQEAEQSLFEISDDVIRIQREQLMEGMRSDDEQIFKVKTGSIYYSPAYAKYKGKDEPIDLHDKGGFYAEIHTTQESEGLMIKSDDSKSEMLQEEYGKKVLGLGTQSIIELSPIAGERLIRNVEIQTNER